MIPFSETITVNGKDITITVTGKEPTSEIIKKVLDIEFKGEVKAFQDNLPGNEKTKPDQYLVYRFAFFDPVYADNQVICHTDYYDIFIFTRQSNQISTLAKRICAAISSRGMFIADPGEPDYPTSTDEEFTTQKIRVSLLRDGFYG